MTERPNGTTAFRLDELARRIGEFQDECRDRDKNVRDRLHTLQGEFATFSLVAGQLPDILRRIDELEDQNVAVLARDVRYLEKKVDSMARALWTFAGAVVLAAVTFALSVASGQIG